MLHSGLVPGTGGPSCPMVRLVEVRPLENDEWISRGRIRACLRSDDEARRASIAVSAGTFAPAFLADCAEGWKAVKRLMLPTFGDRRIDATGAKDMHNWFDDLSITRACRRTARWRGGHVIDVMPATINSGPRPSRRS